MLTIVESQSQDRYWDLFNFSAEIDSEKVGYLRIEYVNPIRVRAAMPTPWHYKSLRDGWHMDLTNLYNVWLRSHDYARVEPKSCMSNGPSGWFDWQSKRVDGDTMKADLLVLDDRMGYTKARNSYFRMHHELAFISYISVEKLFQRQGIATKLYLRAGRVLAGLGLPIYSSTLISDEAKLVWKSMFDSNKHPITISKKAHHVSHDGVRQYRYKMDFRIK